MLIPKETVDDIVHNSSITEVIGHYIPLIKKGRGYTAICPFHDDHDPSLSISEDRHMYKCFVCNNGGDAVTFVRRYKNISFQEAVIEVSKIIGKPIDIKIDKPKVESKFKREYELLDSCIKYSNYLLMNVEKASVAHDYLINRGLDDEVINHFEIGYNPIGNVLYNYLKSKNFTDEEMIKVNVARLLDNGMADVFYNRVLFPIHDIYGNPVAFSARTLDKDNDAKYINTSDTQVYVKGNVLYNYHRIKDTIKKSFGVIVCEGVMDVIAYYRAGIENVVATLGTACSQNQLKLLKSLNKNLILGYDGDKAGIKANLRLGEMALKEGLSVEVIDNDTELDPDEIIAKYGKNGLRDLSSKRISFIDYALKHYKDNYNLDNYNERKKYHEIMLSLIGLLKDSDDIENYTNELFSITKIRKRINSVAQKGYNETVIKPLDLDGLTYAEYIILSQIALSNKACDIYQKELGCLLDKNNHQLACMIVDEYRRNNKCQFSLLYEEANDNELKNLIATIATIEILPSEYNEEILKGAIQKEKRELKYRQLEVLKDKINKTKVVDPETTQEYLRQYQDLIKELGVHYKR